MPEYVDGALSLAARICHSDIGNSKTDAVDADALAQCAERMPYQPWVRPATEALMLRALARRVNTLTRNKAAANISIMRSVSARGRPERCCASRSSP